MQAGMEHYFDWAATAPSDEDILKDSLAESIKYWGNPSSAHQLGNDAKSKLIAAREKCAACLKVESKNLYFTSGGTESDHIPLLSLLNRPERGTVLVSSIEHPAVREMAESLKHCGMKVVQIPSDRNGFITPEAVTGAMTDDTLFISVMAVNNETGAVQDIYAISDAITQASLGKRRPKFHVDCVQALGKIPLDISYKGIDSAAFSAHKISGPRGVGLLYSASPIEAFTRGGGQESGIRSGTENLFGIISFSQCMERYVIPYEISEQKESVAYSRYEEQKKLTKNFIQKISAIKGCTIVPPSRLDESLNLNFSPWVVQAAFNGIPGQVMVRALSAMGYYISTGSACSAKKQSRPILEAMGISKEVRENAVRFSFGPATTAKAMDDLYEELLVVTKTFAH